MVQFTARTEHVHAARKVQGRGRPAQIGDPDTRRRLLDAAREFFAAKGMATTVREVCARAQANVAAVHYHFGSKEALLAEVLRHFLAEILVAYPLDGGVSAGAPGQDRLFGFAHAFLCRILCTSYQGGYLAQILSQAFVRPLPAFESHAQAHRKDVRHHMGAIIRDIWSVANELSESLGERQLELFGRSIVAQILFYNTNRELLLAERQGRFTSEEIGALARHITLFSIGGIHRVAELRQCDRD